jgi:uncharacterized protein
MKMAILIKIVVVCFVLWLGLRWFERANLYFPDKHEFATPDQVGLPYEDVWMRTSDGVRIHGWFILASKQGLAGSQGLSGLSGSANQTVPTGLNGQTGQTGKTLLFCHGNAGNISHRLDKVKRLLPLGVNVFLFDYRGYGQSDGRPSEQGTYRDGDAAYQWLVQKLSFPRASGGNPAMDPPPETARDDGKRKIILYGESLGGAVAAELAVRHPEAAGLILESAFTSTVDMARRFFPRLPARWVIRNRYDTFSKVRGMRMPLLVLHSRQDDIVPFSMAERNLAAAGGPKQLAELVGDHNEGYIDSGSRYTEPILKFVKAAVREIR